MNKDIKKDLKHKAIQWEAKMPYSVEYDMDETTDGRKVYLLSHPELPGCMAQGESITEALKELREATIEYLLSLLEDDLDIPLPIANTTSTIGYSEVKIIPARAEDELIDTLSKTVQPLSRRHLGVVSIVR